MLHQLWSYTPAVEWILFSAEQFCLSGVHKNSASSEEWIKTILSDWALSNQLIIQVVYKLYSWHLYIMDTSGPAIEKCTEVSSIESSLGEVPLYSHFSIIKVYAVYYSLRKHQDLGVGLNLGVGLKVVYQNSGVSKQHGNDDILIKSYRYTTSVKLSWRKDPFL